MKQARTIWLTLVLAVGVSLGVTPADAQGKSKENKGGKGKQKVEQVRRDRNDDRYERRDVRYDSRDDVRQSGRKKGVPPGWCKGRGNPHNTVANCGRDGERYDPRDDDRRDRRSDDRYERGSFEERHDYFHRVHDAQCRERAAQRPLDVRWQIQVRSECSAEHERWHARNDPSRNNQPTLLRRP
jgi:hypothetical protein